MIKTAIKAAKKAGKISMKHFNSELEIGYKEKNEIVTNADKEAEEAIIKIIKKKFPEHSIWSEERDELKTDSDYRWVIDPIDGTFVFSRGVPFFGISIGIEYKKNPVAGVLYFPALKRLYHAEKGKGAFLNNKKISVSNKNNGFILASTEVLRHPNKLLKPYHKELIERKVTIKSFGSTALEMAFVAEGVADACYESGIKPGDISAGIILVREAGGIVTNLKGKKAKSNSKTIIARNRKCDILKKILR